jgi:hypothetical protein
MMDERLGEAVMDLTRTYEASTAAGVVTVT